MELLIAPAEEVIWHISFLEHRLTLAYADFLLSSEQIIFYLL